VIIEDDVEAVEHGGVEDYAFVTSMGYEPASLDEALAHKRIAVWDKEITHPAGART
jgi:hypothetical protein